VVGQKYSQVGQQYIKVARENINIVILVETGRIAIQPESTKTKVSTGRTRIAGYNRVKIQGGRTGMQPGRTGVQQGRTSM
jgi:hypothetical protein